MSIREKLDVLQVIQLLMSYSICHPVRGIALGLVPPWPKAIIRSVINQLLTKGGCTDCFASSGSLVESFHRGILQVVGLYLASALLFLQNARSFPSSDGRFRGLAPGSLDLGPHNFVSHTLIHSRIAVDGSIRLKVSMVCKIGGCCTLV
jgi:hypothetical protein